MTEIKEKYDGTRATAWWLGHKCSECVFCHERFKIADTLTGECPFKEFTGDDSPACSKIVFKTN